MAIEPGTGLVLAGGAIAAQDAAKRLLGPTADYLGQGLRHWTERGFENLNAVFSSAIRKLGHRLDEPGSVPPRILKGVLEEGPFCDDFVAAEYLGGVLASSRSGVSRDDRGVTFIQLLRAMSTYEVRSHYVLYHIAKQLLDGYDVDFSDGMTHSYLVGIYVPTSVYDTAMDFVEDEVASWDELMGHTLVALYRHDLISDYFGGSQDEVRKHYAQYGLEPSEGGLICKPTAFGTELFLWANGEGGDVSSFLARSSQFEFDTRVEIPEGSEVVAHREFSTRVPRDE